MKIGILCTGRCGSTSLYYALLESILNKENYKFYFEPNNGYSRKGNKEKEHNKVFNISPDFSHLNLIIKDVISFIPGPIPYEYNLGISSLKKGISDYYIDYSKNFDQIILLTRKNELHSAQSWRQTNLTNVFHQPWVFDTKDINNYYPPLEELEQVRNSNDILYTIARELKKPIVYFEDIFTKDLFDATGAIDTWSDDASRA